MSAQSFVNFFAVVVGFIAALFFCVGSALLTRKSIGELAGTYWDSNLSSGQVSSSTKGRLLLWKLGALPYLSSSAHCTHARSLTRDRVIRGCCFRCYLRVDCRLNCRWVLNARAPQALGPACQREPHAELGGVEQHPEVDAPCDGGHHRRLQYRPSAGVGREVVKGRDFGLVPF
jgi:hypothetical protein